MRIPRKKKKKFKLLWFKVYRHKRFIIKNSIDYTVYPNSNGKKVWGCITRFDQLIQNQYK